MPRLQRLAGPLAAALRGRRLEEKAYFRHFWALKDIDFVVGRGQTVGIIGKNGSGKSTLLKLVCGTLAPSSGEIELSGRVAALLELGSGFNPEFSGRENIYLNASVLGLTRAEIDERLDDIIAFADIGDFVEEPVKTYSSGMAMRLAFAVMAHVDADVLVVDEALAVGDAHFQQKCMRWLRQFRQNGTVLFCTHDLGSVLSFCDQAVWIDKGKIRMSGIAKDVCEGYSAFVQAEAMGLPEEVVKFRKSRPDASKAASQDLAEAAASGPVVRPVPPPPVEGRPVIFDSLQDSASFGSRLAEITEVAFTAIDGEPLHWIVGGEDVLVTAHILIKEEIDRPIVGFHVKDRLGQAILGDNTYKTYEQRPMTLAAGDRLSARFSFRLPHLATGRYAMTVAIASGTIENHVQHHWLHDALFFDVHSEYRNGVLIAVPIREMTLSVESPAMPN